ncbi:MAG: tape measure protein [Micropruina sp.]|nr:tape measure protein [Micropruina sp.]
MALDLGTLFARFRVDDSGMERDLKGVEAKSTGFLGGLGGKLAGAVAAFGLATMAKDAVSLGISTAGAMENASIAFETMLGSGQAAQVFLSQLKDFAAKTPFEFPELQTAASSLISIGVDAGKVIPIMTTLGNVTSGMGTGSEGVKRATVAIQQMIAAGRIQAEDLNQLRDAGIPVYDLLAAATGKSKEEISKLAQTGKLGKDELTAMMDALASGKGLEQFAGLMDKQSNSLLGMWSTFQDTWGVGLATAFEPILPAIKDGLGGVSEFLTGSFFPGVSGALEAFAGSISWIGQVWAAIFDPSIDTSTLGGAGQVLVDLGTAATGMWDAVQPLFGTVAAGFLTIFAALSGGGPTVDDLSAGFYGAFTAVQTFADYANPALQGLFGWIAGSLVPAVQGFAAAVGGYLATLMPIYQQVADWFMSMLPTLQPILASIGELITSFVDLASSILIWFTTTVGAFWAEWGGTILSVATAVWNQVIGIIGPAIDIIVGIVKAFAAIFKGDWSGLWDAIKGIVKSAGDLLTNSIQGSMDLMWSIVSSVGGQVLGWFQGFPGMITGVFAGAGSWLVDAGRAIIDGFFAGLKASWGAVTDFVGGIASWIAANKGPLDYDYGLLQPAGQIIIQGLGDSMVGSLPGLRKSLDRVTGTIAGTSASMSGALASGTSAAGAQSAVIHVYGTDGLLRETFSGWLGDSAASASASARRGVLA